MHSIPGRGGGGTPPKYLYLWIQNIDITHTDQLLKSHQVFKSSKHLRSSLVMLGSRRNMFRNRNIGTSSEHLRKMWRWQSHAFDHLGKVGRYRTISGVKRKDSEQLLPVHSSGYPLEAGLLSAAFLWLRRLSLY